MMNDQEQLIDEIEAALEILKKRLKINTRMEVIEHLIDRYDVTIMQLARRSLKLKDNAENDDNIGN